ncbi:MAG: insulinase family protein [Acidobacteria bacterium]|nr:insulinase family protein [Acidobacteriota bacterium]
MTKTTLRWSAAPPLLAALALLSSPQPANAQAKPVAAAPQEGAEIKVQEHTLSNGMKLLLVPRAGEPTIAGGWVAHVGSANEKPGITGLAHLFEHMLFKGSKTIGTKDYAKDQQIIAEQEKVRDAMRAEVAGMRAALKRGEIDDLTKPENKTARYKELEAKFDELVKAQRDILVKNEFDLVYKNAGGSGMNATTNYDSTIYFITVPKNKLEMWMWMESDRLLNGVFREFYSERDVVYEERRLRVEAPPTGRLEEAFDSIFWHSTPYAWPVIGYPSELPFITKAQADEFYATFYAPNNLTAVLVGDFDPKEALVFAERYFGRIPRGQNPVPEVVTLPPTWNGEVRMTGEAETNPEVEVRFHTVPFGHKDSYPLQVLANVLSGRTGRLYKGLVDPENPANAVATQAFAGQQSGKHAGAFGASAEAREGKTPEDVERGILAEIERLKSEPVGDRELQKVKNNANAATYRRLQTNNGILFQLVFADGLGDWREVNAAPKRIQSVTAADVQRVARQYLTKENRAVYLVNRKAGSAEDPEVAAALAGLPEQARPMVKQRLSALAQEKDAAKLRQDIERMEAQSGNVPPAMKAGFDLLLSRSKARLAEIGKK